MGVRGRDRRGGGGGGEGRGGGGGGDHTWSLIRRSRFR